MTAHLGKSIHSFAAERDRKRLGLNVAALQDGTWHMRTLGKVNVKEEAKTEFFPLLM